MTESVDSAGRGGVAKWLLLGMVFSVLAVTLSEGLRERVLDALFGAEEEFEYEPSLNGSSHSAGVGTPAGQPSQN